MQLLQRCRLMRQRYNIAPVQSGARWMDPKGYGYTAAGIRQIHRQRGLQCSFDNEGILNDSLAKSATA